MIESFFLINFFSQSLENNYWVANLGDSRTIILESVPFGDWVKPIDPALVTNTDLGLRFSTTDHKPSAEKTRIIKTGHNVISGRIDCSLSVSRSFGDFRYKNNPNFGPDQQAVIATPEVSKISKCENDEFIVLGCDGIFGNILCNKEMTIAIRSKCAEIGDMVEAAKEILHLSLKRSSLDNMTVLIIKL